MPTIFKHQQTKQKLHLGNRGDTIVEVLIAIAVVSLILAGAYRISGQSLNTIRDSQEHSQAMQIAQSQLDVLNSHGGLNPLTHDCFDASGNLQVVDPLDPTDTSCKFDSDNNNNCTSTSAYCYNVKITQPHILDPFPQSTYRVTVTWARVGGGNNNVSMDYRVGPSSLAAGIANFGDVCEAYPWIAWCSFSLCETACPVVPPSCPAADNSCYIWKKDKFNAQSIAQDPFVVSCTWDWGDGETTGGPASDPANACKANQPISHTYTAGVPAFLANPLTQFPNGCYQYGPKTITLTVRFNNGAPDDVISRDAGNIPECRF